MGFIQQLQIFLKGMFQWWVAISPWEQGIRVRFGKNTKLLEPGMHLKFPIFDVVYVQPIRIRAQHIRPQTLTTKDGKTISLSSAIQYKIDNILELYSSVHNPQEAIEGRIQGAIAEYVCQQNLDDLHPANIEKHIDDELKLAEFGIDFKKTNITSFASVRTYRFISGEMGTWSDYNERLETSSLAGEKPGT